MRLSLMLAFQAIITHGENAKSEMAAQKVIGLAKLMNEFCDLHLPQAFPEQLFAELDDKKSIGINANTSTFWDELRERGASALPGDRETLVKLYDHLQHRKTQYSQWEFYARASKEELAEAILRLLREVDALRMGGGQCS